MINEEQTTLPFCRRASVYEIQAQDWISTNPAAFALFERFALEMAARGRRFGMKQLAERCRWEVLATWEKDADGYRINNNIVAYLGRELVRRHPHLSEYLETRQIRARQVEVIAA